VRSNIDQPASVTRVASTPILFAPWANAAASAARFTATARRLPTVFRTPMVAHALSTRVPAPRRLQSLVSALHGRLSVVNPTHVARLPAGLVAAVHGLVRVGFDGAALTAKAGWEPLGLHPNARTSTRVRRGGDPRGNHELRMARALLSGFPSSVHDGLSEGITWTALALYESTAPNVRLIAPGGHDATDASASAVAMAAIGYRLAIVAGSGTAPDWQALDRVVATGPVVGWPLRLPAAQSGAAEPASDQRAPWFVASLLVPDTWLSAHADPETLAHWARLTGRSGAPDRYWFPEMWDRFLEPGRRVGWLTANDVWRPRRGRLPSAASPEVEDAGLEDDPPARRGGLALTPDLERGVGVPPGYALVQCVGMLELTLVVSR
jgi:hypothetical protein